MHGVTAILCGAVSFTIYLLVLMNRAKPAAHEQLKQNSDEAIIQAKSFTAPSPTEVASLVQPPAPDVEACKYGPNSWAEVGMRLGNCRSLNVKRSRSWIERT